AIVSDLGECGAIDEFGIGGCDITLADDVTGDVVLVLVAVGEDDTRSAPATQPITIGEGPSLDTFAANPIVLSEAGTTTLSWTSDAADVSLTRGVDEVVFDTLANSNVDQCASGQCDG